MPRARLAIAPLASRTGAKASRTGWSKGWSPRRSVPNDKPAPFRLIDHKAAQASDDRAEVIAALLATPARIAPKFFYDELGCAIYGAICRLPEYYPTRTEMA